ncbi:MAG: ASCH domain-containing protein [Elusimicrobiota bacterium]
MTAQERPRAFKFGWYGDSGLGDALIDKILRGEKTATMCPAYDPKEADVNDVLNVVDKSGKPRAVVRVVQIENKPFCDIDEAIAHKIGSTLNDVRRITSFANSRQIGKDEEMRVTHFELVKIL